jgi:hypothetical protein
MKTFIIITVVIIGIILLFQTYLTMAADQSDSQPYKVIKVEKDFEIRFYPSATMASITSTSKTYKQLGSSGFRKLAGYIFGGNEANTKIAMTAPVYMDINDSASTMSFVMPVGYNPNNLPKPNDSDVAIHTTEDKYVAAITFGGYADDEKIKEYTQKLETALKASSIPYFGRFLFLGYNAPYQFFGRKNEIIVSVVWDNKAK